MPETALSSVGLLAVVLVLVLAGVIALLLWLQARDRREIASLLERLERLESTRAARSAETTVVAPEADAQADLPAPPAPREDEARNPSGDVLHGRTTHVQRLIGSAGGEAQSLADQAIVRIHKRIEENVTPHQLAWELCVSLRTLERGLGLALACTPRQLILAMKMREARAMLMQGRKVGDVAGRLGFTNPFHFSRRFKDFYHVSPSEMRPPAQPGD
ncbi:MAG: helix-turn-helix domain-containing protein [Acidobacteria bacterium]|nr:helix-turn-helix domain-containing protein [Acidobacteriota bacterium]